MMMKWQQEKTSVLAEFSQAIEALLKLYEFAFPLDDVLVIPLN